ncbi:uncharacterized protein LOC107473343 [Arachis duranensis]|uniref:Uncharacterized protein LOC107473343 n=1 Tax=Arachis duranensis TaxID=130453 RepID=A0A9C6TGG1_ARADU|nr:uncharacterized protein LOC107473343 [Arachis duranensis]
MSTNIEAISSVNEYDGTEPLFEQLFTDSDEEYDVNKDQYVESYLDDEEWNEDDYTSEEESEVEVNIENEGEIMKRFDVEDNEKISLKKFMIFVDVHEFRSVLRDYIIQENFDIIRVKNEKVRVSAICASEGCPWRIHASPSPDGIAFMIKSYESRHTCIRKSEKRNANSTWIAKKLKQSLNADPNMSYELMSNELITKFGVEAHPKKLYRARRKGREEVEGSHALSYKKIVKFANMLLEKNRGSIVRLEYYDQMTLEEENHGCHLKGPYGGVLLCAVSLDANNGLFPIAFAIVEAECRDSWSFFLNCLHDALEDDHNLRSMTVLKLVDGLRVKIMMRFYTQFSSTASWSYNVGPRIATEINKTTEDARYCKVKPAGGHRYEVYDGFTRFPVNLVLHTCECKAWQINGLPCKHSAAAIIYIREKVENYCDAYYHKDKYIITYYGLHSPLPDLDTLDDTNVLPPSLRRLPGRPRKSRIREKDEDAPSNARRISTVRCSNCKDLGHNRKGCQRAPEISASESQTSMIKQTQQHASAQAKAKSQLQAKQIKRG